MRPYGRIRVEISLPPTPASWHAAVVDAVRAVDGAVIVDREADVAIDLAGRNPPVVPPLGVWRYGFGDGASVANGAAGTMARLYRTTTDPARAVVLREGWYRARTAHAWGTDDVGLRVATWCADVIREVLAGEVSSLAACPQSTQQCRDLYVPQRRDSWTVPVADAMRDWFTRQRWTIGLVAMNIADIMERGQLPEPAWLRGQPRDRFYADPFPLCSKGDRVDLLVEDYHYASRRKRLARIEVDVRADLIAHHQTEGLPESASYPFLLRPDQQADVICIPETFRAQRVSAFARDGNGRWRRCGDLLEGFPAVDATIVERDGRWWLFCMKQGDEDQTELHLFHARDWRGPWTPHLSNPVKSDTRSSRPAGACFDIDGVLYRPAQNCSHHYGAGITINKVLELTPTRFREEPHLSLSPASEWTWPDGLHTINTLDGMTVVDGLRLERRLGPARFARPRTSTP